MCLCEPGANACTRAPGFTVHASAIKHLLKMDDLTPRKEKTSV